MAALIDTHGHIITKAIYPRELFVGRFGIPRILVEGLVEAVEEGRRVCWPVRFVWAAMPGKLRRYERLVQLFAGTMRNQAEELAKAAKAADVGQVWVLGLDIPNVGDFRPVSMERALTVQLELLTQIGEWSAGRLVPFYPFDPRREGAITSLLVWFSTGAFRGVKMYPPLGFNVEQMADPKTVWGRAMREAFEFFEAKEIPVVVHCSGGGVRGLEVRQGDMKWLASPERWRPVLKVCPDLKVCFAHGTGEGGFLSLPDPRRESWAWHLRDLMLRHPGVYADVAFHEGIVKTKGAYRQAMERVVHDAVRHKVLFGSDAPLHFGEYSYGELIACAREAIPGIDTLMVSNAQRFLGTAV